MALREYRKKRAFDRTPEPEGRDAPTTDGPPRFVVQRHRARRLHYDFRLEIDSVLVSWAVPKGITLDPTKRHLAVRVEDHPLDYIDFEGVIPKGEYGGGDVIVWDRGTWVHHGPGTPREAIEAGELHIELFGQKLRGRVVLIRTGEQRGKEQWLVLHKRDEYAVAGWDPEAYPRSVLTGRTNEEVARDPERSWTRNGAEAIGDAGVRDFAGPTPDELAALDQMGTKG
ncbi:MAG: bifunctional non-ous end joining protein LigD, partial [Actinomycetota bacterium]|nr:bifunctional non-ous end joining protein LigD [Actinomycetota bacterium]